MANNELKTTLNLDIKPFLDAIKRASNQISTLQELRPKFNTAEFQTLQRQIAGFKPDINVAVRVDKTALDAVENEIKLIGEDPVEVEVLINSEEIQRAVNRTQELRSTALTIPPVTNLKVDFDSNIPELTKDIDLLESTARKLVGLDYFPKGEADQAKFSVEELQTALALANDSLKQFGRTVADIPGFTPDIKGLKLAHDEFENLNKRLQEFNRTALALIFPGLEEAQPKIFQSQIGLQTLEEIIENIQRKSKDLRFDITFDEQKARDLIELQKDLSSRNYQDITIDAKIEGTDVVKRQVEEVKKAVQGLPETKEINVTAKDENISVVRDSITKIGNALSVVGQEFRQGFRTKEAQEQINNLADTIDRRIGSKTVTITVPKQKPIADLNDIQKEVNDLPSKKNININVDASGPRRPSEAVSGVSGFVGQLGSGLLASFSGAAIGAAVANFASQSVRAIVRASDAADELNNKLKIAFTQAGQGIGGFELETQLQNANRFALDLGNNFGISITRSKELLAQVTGLTGEFGATSEAITKASIGIEEATGGLVKAETAAKLFSRSIGNPEDQAALETLAKRFPAIGEAIKGATDPAEKANAVLSNLTGTFESLEEKSRGFGVQFQLLSEVSFGAFATGIVPIFDAFVPILENLRKVVTDNAGAFEQFGERVVTQFIEPLVKQLIDAGPQISEFGATLFELFSISSKISFASLQLGIELLAEAFSLLSAVIEPFKPILDGLADSFRTALGSITGAFGGELESVNELVSQFSFGLLDAKDSVQGLNPIFDRLKSGFTVIEPIVRSLGDNISNFLIPAFAALKVAIEALFLPLRVYNFLAEQASGLSKDLSFDIDALGVTIAKLSVFFTPLLQIANVIKNIRGQRLNTQELGADIGAVGSQFTGLGNSVRSLVSGYQLLSINQKKLDLGGGGGGGVSKAKKDAGETLSLIEKQIIAYDDLAKVIESRYAVEKTQIDANEKVRSAALGRQLNDNEKLAFELQRINVLTRQQTDLQNALSSQFGISRDSINDLAKAFLETGNLAAIPINIGGQNIQFNPNDSKNKQSFQKVAELLVKSLNTSIELEGEKAENQVKYSPNVELDTDRFNADFDAFEVNFQRQLNDLEFGRIPVINFDIEKVKKDLEQFRTTASTALSAVNTQLATNQKQTADTVAQLNQLVDAGQGNSVQAAELAGKLDALRAEYDALTKKTETYNGVLVKTQNTLDTLGDSIEQTISQRFRRLQQANEIKVTFDLNAQGVNEQLIEIERNFGNSILAIEQFFAQSFARIQAEQGNQVGPSDALKGFAEAQQNALRNAAVQREIAIRQFRQQNDALFAITQSFGNNLASALVPNTLVARRGLNERQKQIDSQLELLRANLDAELQLNKDNLQLRTLSYQEYTEKVLELEKQKSESIKQYEEEVSQARLQALQKIADEALPAIQNQLQLANAELTVLFQDSAASFEDVANKGLETIGLVAAQSLALAVQQAKSLEDVQRLFLRNIVSGLLRVLRVQLEAAIIGALFTEVQQKSFAGLVTGAIISGILVGLFAAAEAKILASIGGFESGGYTGNGGTKDIAGVVHGQEYVVNAKGTRDNRKLLEWINKGKPAESFFNTNKDIRVDNFIDTKGINQSINSLAYTMDARLSSLETTVDRAIRQNATLTRSANQLDVSVYSDPGTAIKYMKKMGKIKGLT